MLVKECMGRWAGRFKFSRKESQTHIRSLSGKKTRGFKARRSGK